MLNHLSDCCCTMRIKTSAIFLMIVLFAGFASFPSSIPNFDNEIAEKYGLQNQLINMAFADSHNVKGNDKAKEKQAEKQERQDEKQEKLAEKQAEKEDKALQRAEKLIEKLAKKQAEKDRYHESNIQEFTGNAVIVSSSTTFVQKVTLCHIPPGNPDNAHTITVGSPAVAAHLAHGDDEGPCDGQALSITDFESKRAEKQTRLDEKQAEKEDNALQRAEKLIEKLEQRIAKLEQRLQTLLEKLESGEYFGNLPRVDAVTKTYTISFAGTASSIFDDSVTNDVSGEIFIENLLTTSNVSKFKVTGGEIFVGDNIYDAVFGKARVSTGISGEKDSMVLILETIDIEGNNNTVRLTLTFDSTLEGDFGTEPIEFEIIENSKISGQWLLSGSGQLSLLEA